MSSPESTPSILIVDDDPSSLRALSALLTNEGYSVRSAPDGPTAITIAEAEPPALIVLDIAMPGMDGYEVCRRLGDKPTTRDIPILFASGVDENMDRVKAFSAGAVGHVTKPVQAEEVLTHVKTHLTLDRLRKELAELQQELDERIQVQETLEYCNNRYALAQRAARIGSWDWNILTGDLYWSDEIEPLFGFGPGEFGRTYEAFLACVHPEDRSFVSGAVDAAVEQGTDYAIEHRIVWPDGTVRWVAEAGDVLRDGEGKAVRMVGIVRDITELKSAEQALRVRTRELGDRVKELNCFYQISALVDRPGISLDEILQGTADLIPAAWQYPEATCARIVMDDREFRSADFRETDWTQARDIVVHGEHSGTAQVYRLDSGIQDNDELFLEEEGMLLNAITERLGRIIERFRAREALQQRLEEMAVLSRITRAVTTSASLPETLRTIAEDVTDLLTARVTLFAVPDAEQSELRVLTGFERLYGTFATTRGPFPLDQMPITRQVMDQRQSIVLSDVQAYSLPAVARAYVSELGLHSLMLVPLLAGGVAIGLLVVGSDQPNRTFTSHEVLLGETVAGDAAAAVENARLSAQARAAAVDAERQRLARELHDSVAQSLYSMTLLANGWRTLAQQGRLESPAACFEQLEDVGQQALGQMRLLIHQLRPPILEEVGLVGALQQRLEAVEQRAGIQARLLTEGPVQDLPRTVEEQLFYIAQEALNNALRHAYASQVVVRIRAAGVGIVLSIEDNGVGFDLTAASGGLGLTTMRERTERIGGVLSISSVPGQGTTVDVTVDVL